MDGITGFEPDYSGFVEVDPTGRYGRYNEILGKGASKTVYRAFDEYEGIEVAWNQVKLHDFLHSPEELERLYCEIHLLKTLKHKNIMKFYTSWVDASNRNINFVTEMFTSGTLRQYRLKHRRVNMRAVKNWCRQILEGLLYLHSHDPPVIHRDLKCDNIFINGNQGEVKIGDLGLAAILPRCAARCVGTPEFMAPEVYEEEYNELIDIYSFGMCILEMVTSEYPYSECAHPAQIYKKVISGKMPEALYKVRDPEVRQFVEKCLATVSSRLPAGELLRDPFLQIDEHVSDMRLAECYRNFELEEPLLTTHHNSISSFTNGSDPENYLSYRPIETREIDLFSSQEEELGDADITIKGRRRDDDGIFLRLRIVDKEGRIRNIYFPFDTDTDTALSVATEMVAELDITDQDVTRIADMMDVEIANLVPEWKRGSVVEEDAWFCHNCADYVSSNSVAVENLQVISCANSGCTTIHGRFEEVTYHVQGSEQCATETQSLELKKSGTIHYADIWAQRNTLGSGDETPQNPSVRDNQEQRPTNRCRQGSSVAATPAACWALSNGCENEIRRELRWLKARYQMQLRELRDKQLGVNLKTWAIIPSCNNPLLPQANEDLHLPGDIQQAALSSVHDDACVNSAIPLMKPEPELLTSNSFCTGAFHPHSLYRATSLPVDAVDV